jgi:hypothetical protein
MLMEISAFVVFPSPAHTESPSGSALAFNPAMPAMRGAQVKGIVVASSGLRRTPPVMQMMSPMERTVLIPAVPTLRNTPPAMQMSYPAQRPRSRAEIVMAAKMTDASGAEIKSALSAYMHFCNERRAGLTAELKASMGNSFKNTAVMSGLGAEWKQLGETQKERFAEMAVQDKARFDAAVASNPANAKAPKKQGKLSAYMHFCADRRSSLTAELKASMGEMFKQPAVMSALGAEWKQLDATAKARFEQMAANGFRLSPSLPTSSVSP